MYTFRITEIYIGNTAHFLCPLSDARPALASDPRVNIASPLIINRVTVSEPSDLTNQHFHRVPRVNETRGVA